MKIYVYVNPIPNTPTDLKTLPDHEKYCSSEAVFTWGKTNRGWIEGLMICNIANSPFKNTFHNSFADAFSWGVCSCYLLCGLIPPPDVIWALFVMIRGAALSPCTKHKTTSAIQSCTLHMPPQKHKTPNAKHKKHSLSKENFFKKKNKNSYIRNRGLRFGDKQITSCKHANEECTNKGYQALPLKLPLKFQF